MENHQRDPTGRGDLEKAVPEPPPTQPITLEQPVARPGETIEHCLAEQFDLFPTLVHPSTAASGLLASDFSIGPVGEGKEPSKLPLIPGYELLGELGRGGMGVVYKARHLKLNRLVGLKMVLAGAHAGSVQLARFAVEAQAVARLTHTNIVQIYEIGEHNGLPFFSLEYIDGGSLAAKIAGKPQPPRDAAALVEPLARTMAFAHAKGIIHRDLKPANILLMREEGRGMRDERTKDGSDSSLIPHPSSLVPKITDFGLAKRLEDESGQTKSGVLLGTPSYMSPEQACADSGEIGPLSDQYSLGAILYELLTGRPPFAGASIMETIFQVRMLDPVKPTRLQLSCPRDLETICLKCLEKLPAQRYLDCNALADDLRRFLNGEPIRARPVSWFERGWRWCRRNPRVATLSAAVSVLLLMVAASFTAMFVRLSREHEAVAESRKSAATRIEQAAAAAAGGNLQRAGDLLQATDPLLDRHLDLAGMRAELATLKAQVAVHAEFRRLLDNARFACRFGSRRQKEEGRRICGQLLALYDEIEERTGRGADGLPPLDAHQHQLFKEDVFEAFLTAALVEQEVASGNGDAVERKAARQALEWYKRAEQILPGTRALRVQRAVSWSKLGNKDTSKADIAEAKKIEPVSAVEHFWHGYAHHLRGQGALARNDVKAAREWFRKEIAEYAAFLQQRPDHFWGYFNWANSHIFLNDRADLHDALVGYTACIRLRPDLPQPYNNRGTAHWRLGEHDLAAADFNSALERNESYAEAHANRALVYAAQGKTELALAGFSRSIELKPDYSAAYADRAELYVKRKEYDKAAQDFTRLIALSAEKAPLYLKRAAVYRAMNQSAKASADRAEFARLLKDRVARVDALVFDGKYEEARVALTSVLKLVPKNANLWQTRAKINWLKLKEFDEAIADWEKVTRLQPTSAEAYFCIGATLLGRREYSSALAALQKAIDLKPDYPQALWARAQIYLWQGRPGAALRDLDPLVAKLPNGPPETLNVRAGVYEALGQLDKAMADYQRMTELRPESPSAYLCLARLCQKQNQPDKAAAHLDRLVAAAPFSERAWLRRAELRRDQGRFEAALADCDRAARFKPGTALPALVRASIEAAQDRSALAVEQAERALETAPNYDGHALYAAACVYSLASRTAEPTEAKRLASRAADLLAEALDRGFHDLNYPEHNRMADDPALAPIRQMPRVRDLLSRRDEADRRRGNH
jgi:serine/threonine protein kinase/tetratricopeptide (TPR) repeat protein